MSSIKLFPSEVLDVIGDRVTPVVEAGSSGGAFELFVVEGDRGSGPPPHAHPWLESYYVLDGELLVELDGDSAVAEPGQSAVVPSGHVHRFEVVSPSARFVVVTGGDGASRFFRDLATNAPGVPTPKMMPTIIEVAKRNGLTSPLF
jgi:quercetin dioxygenase-like cupin family protein